MVALGKLAQDSTFQRAKTFAAWTCEKCSLAGLREAVNSFQQEQDNLFTAVRVPSIAKRLYEEQK
jgi:hypothetical protein